MRTSQMPQLVWSALGIGLVSVLVAGCGATGEAAPVPTVTVTVTAEPEPPAEAPAPTENEPASTPTPAPGSTGDPVIAETFFVEHHLMFRDYGWWSYAVVMENPNTNCVYERAGSWNMVEFLIEAFDASNILLDSDRVRTILLPGETALSGSFNSIGNNSIDRLEVRGDADATMVCYDEGIGGIEFSDVQTSRTGSTTVVSGVATSSFESYQERVIITAVIFDSAGELMATETGRIDRLTGEGAARFEIRLHMTIPADADIQLFYHL